MESKEILYKPKDLYERSLKEQYHKGAEEYFDKLIKETNTDTKANEKHVSEYKTLDAKRKEMEKMLHSSKVQRGFFILFIILFLLAAIILSVLGGVRIQEQWYLLVVGIILLGAGIFFIVYTAKNLAKIIKQREDALAKAQAAAKAKLDECYADLSALNSAYDWNIPGQIMESTTGIIDIDPYFSEKRLEYLTEKFGLSIKESDNRSVLGIISGNIQGNPFIVKKVLQEDYRDKVYTGELLITWTTYSTDSKGNRVSHHHSQVLRATSTHKAPFYGTDTILIYGNEAAPHLSFSRTPSDINSLTSQTQIDRAVKSGMKEIRKKADEAIASGSGFTPTGNDEFDVFFGGNNRNNEVEFRLLFTPLAQANMLSLLKDPEPYGDDFYMQKSGMVNFIKSRHSQSFDYSANPQAYVSYDYTISRNAFVSYCDEYIKNLFFDLAPLLSIPLYQMHKPREYIYEKEIASNYSYFEHEALANTMNASVFIPSGADRSLPLILKSKAVRKNGESDHVKIHSYSYKTQNRTDYIPVLGGDGRFHDVPVNWIQYDRVDRDRNLDMRYVGSSRMGFDQKLKENKRLSSIVGASAASAYAKGMLLMCFDNETRSDLDEILKDVFEENTTQAK